MAALNNAGICDDGPTESQSLDDLRLLARTPVLAEPDGPLLFLATAI